ncbi:MAG: hypothetical protein KDB80_18260, partial [Planctomycetes bacterium]|nr:hypothetical protein [Planctomycetota bacterium]
SMIDYGEGLQIEPFVDVVAEFAIHGWLDPSGASVVGEPTTLVSDADGAWLASSAGADLHVDERTELERATARVANELHSIGYHGPFGVDAFRWVDAEGASRFRVLGELNARFTMGYFVGMQERLGDLLPRWLDP